MWSQDYEEFSENQIKLLKKYVTNTSSHIFALRNLPEVIKGALFSRYSRSSLGLRSLLLKEFINNSGEEADFKAMVNTFATGLDESETDLQEEAIKKAERFYNRILDGYGDDSIGELGGSHLALENISMIAAKAIEDCRIGGSPLEKSTRYIYFDQKVNGEYLFYREPVLMTSAFKEMYIDTCNLLFDTYSRLIPPVTAIIEKKFPQDETSSKTAYAAALRAKVLDCLRGLLPAGTLTNVGISGNGRFFEQLINKLNFNNLSELQAIGSGIYQELTKVIPSFIRRAGTSHHNYQSYATFMEAMQSDILRVSSKHADKCPTVNINLNKPSVNLIYADEDSPVKVAAAILFQTSKASLANLQNYCQDISPEDINLILDAA